MAKNWWEEAPVIQESKQEWWQAAPVVEPAKPEPTESGGFFGSVGSALKERVTTARPAAQLFTGLGDQKAATDELARAKKESGDAYKQTEFSEIGDAFKQGAFGTALGKTVDKFKEVAGSSLGSMAPAMVAGAGAALAAPAALPAAAVGTAAFGLVSLGSYIADNISRQKEEQAKKGQAYEDINRVTATTAAAFQTALDVFGFKFFKPLGQLVGIEGKATAEKAALEIVEAATRPNAYKKAVARGTATGIAFEVPQEVTQSVLERWQAGLALDPFKDPEAAKEYMEAAGGALLLGGPMGAFSRTAQTFQARRTPEGQALLRTEVPAWVQDTLDKEATDVEQPIGTTGGAGAPLAGTTSAVPPAAGPGEPGPPRVVPSGTDVAGAVAGEEQQPGPLTPSAKPPGLFEDVDTGADVQGQKPPAQSKAYIEGTTGQRDETPQEQVGIVAPNKAGQSKPPAAAKPAAKPPAKPPATPVAELAPAESFGEFKEQYDDLRARIATLSKPENRFDLVTKEKREAAEKILQSLVQINSPLLGNLDPMLVDNLADPKFDGRGALDQAGQRRGMQTQMFTKGPSVERRVESALALAGQDREEAVRVLEISKAKLLKDLAAGVYDKTWALSQKAPGLPAGEAVDNVEALAQQHVDRQTTTIDQAIALLSGERRGMQNKLFEEESKPERPVKEPMGGVKPVLQTQEDMLGAAPEDKKANYVSEQEKARQAYGEKQREELLRSGKITPSQIAAQKKEDRERKSGAPIERTGNLFTTEREEKAPAGRAISYVITEPGMSPVEAGTEVSKSMRDQLVTDYGEDVKFERADVYKRRQTTEKKESQPEKEAEQVSAETTEDVEQTLADKAENDLGIANVAKTKEGRLLTAFFDAILPQSGTESEQGKHESLKSVALKRMLSYDIVAKGQEYSRGVRAMLKYVANRMGGMPDFEQALNDLPNMSAAAQSRFFMNHNLPDLTTRRGMEEFNEQIKKYIDVLPGTKEGAAGKVKDRIQNGIYISKVTFARMVTKVHGKTGEGKPRKPSTASIEEEYLVTDRSLPAIFKMLYSLRNYKDELSAGLLAAKNYIENPRRDSFAKVLADAASDLAQWQSYLSQRYGKTVAEIEALAPDLSPEQLNKLPVVDKDVKASVAANTLYEGEGGKYAVDFRNWVNKNLDSETRAIFKSMVADFQSDINEAKKFSEAITKYEVLRKERVQAKLQKAETTTGVKIPRAPKLKPIAKGLPVVQMLSQVNPAIASLLKAGDLKGALKLMADAKNNPYYAVLANRLLDSGLTAKSRVVGSDHLEPLSGKKADKEALDAKVRALSDMIEVSSMDAATKKSILADLNSKKLGGILSAMDRLDGEFKNEAQREILNETMALLDKQFTWAGMYDPVTDEVVLREGGNKASQFNNHTLLHESLHAALVRTMDLMEGSIKRPSDQNKIADIQWEGYSQLYKLYNHAKGILSLEGLSEDNLYGLQDLHEFVSEAMTNPEFQALLREIRFQAAPFSLWNTFTNAVGRIFNVKPNTTDSDVLIEVMKATDAMMAGSMSLEGLAPAPERRGMATKALAKPIPRSLPNTPTSLSNLMNARSWAEVKGSFPILYNSAKASSRPVALGMLTMRQIADLVRNRIPQVNNFIQVAEDFLARKNNILRESGDISKRWERVQSSDPDMSRLLAKVMHGATISEVDPDKATTDQRNRNVQLLQDWNQLSPAAKAIYRQVRDFYERRYEEYKGLMNQRVVQMRQLGVSEQTILEIRNEFEKNKRKGPYFPLMRHGRFWYQTGSGKTREYYMFESAGQKEIHMAQRIAQNPELESTIKEGSEFAQQMDLHARESNFLRESFAAIDSANITGANSAAEKQNLKDSLYQTFLANQPERSFRNQFMHRNNVAGYSEDALRNFASSSFHMAYQMARFEHSPNMFSQIEAARMQLKDRVNVNKGRDVKLSRENNELSDYVTEMDRRLELMLNPTDIGIIPSLLSNIGFIWYLTAPASAIVNILGGMTIGLPTLVGQYVKANPKASYTEATLAALGQMKTAAGQIIATGFNIERGERLRDNRVMFPTLDRTKSMSKTERAAYDRFVADGLIDITAVYDQSGLAASPTESYTGLRHRGMEMLTSLFHNAERFNREVMAMSAFRLAMDKRKGYADKDLAFAESIAEAKDTTNRSMFDYSSPNKPRYFQHPVARVVLQFKQFPQQMTFFLVHNMVNMLKGATPADRREARARFVGTMGMAGIFSGVTGLWGFSTVASIVNAVVNGLADEDEPPFEFELEFADWAVETFGKNVGTMLTRGIGNAAGIDLAGRLKLDDMWLRDSRKNQDEVEALQSFLVDLLGPTVGLAVNAAQAVKLYNEGHADRALETIAPAFIKQPLVAARYANEGVNTLRGDPLMEEVGPFYLFMQSLGLRSAELAEIQFYNITIKGQEQAILKERQNLLNLYALAFMANDADTVDKAYDKIDKFNSKNPTVFIPAESMSKSITERLKKSSQTDHGLYIDPKLEGVLRRHTYLD